MYQNDPQSQKKKKTKQFLMQDTLICFHYSKKVICVKFGADDLPPFHVAKGLKNGRRGQFYGFQSLIMNNIAVCRKRHTNINN